ncbi:hypothetical protein PR048_019848, partial [Dryococelus australis]
MFVNANVVYCYIFLQVPFLEFRRAVATGLMVYKTLLAPKASPGGVLGQKRLSTDNRHSSGKRKLKKLDVGEGNQGIHWPKFVKERGRYEYCSVNNTQSRPHSKCSHCNVYLCCNEKRNCFALYHSFV